MSDSGTVARMAYAASVVASELVATTAVLPAAVDAAAESAAKSAEAVPSLEARVAALEKRLADAGVP